VLAFQANDAKAAASWAERGLKVDPQNGRLRVNLASAEAREGRFDEARTNLKRVVDTSDDEGARSYARTLLEDLDRRAAMPRMEPLVGEAPASAPVTNTRPSLIRRPADGGERHIRVADGEVRGTVTRIECDGGRMTVHVVVSGHELTFTAEDASTMILGTLNLDALEHETIDCGKPLDREAWVQFDPSSPGALTGTLKAVIFTQPAR
jgi:hypothetical protein